jgi:hypothetical protein
MVEDKQQPPVSSQTFGKLLATWLLAEIAFIILLALILLGVGIWQQFFRGVESLSAAV